ncbi:armadillo-type protein, partial [Dunaliella salina]
MADDDSISLRPVCLKPGGAGSNPFKQFGAGAGFGIKAKKATTTPTVDDTVEPKKEWERIKYSKDFLMQFMERNTKCPLEVQQLGLPEIVISEDSERDQQRQVLQKVAEDIDDRDWRARDEAAPGTATAAAAAAAAADGGAAPAKPAAPAPPTERTKLNLSAPTVPPAAKQPEQQLSKQPDPESREEMERAVKKRVMGNMRLISELYKLDMVKDWIMTYCIEELLSAPKGKLPPEDNIEAACEMITTAGGRLSKSEKADTRRKLDDVMKTLEKLAGEKALASRIRFVIKDVL